jgi:hypothetical protein
MSRHLFRIGGGLLLCLHLGCIPVSPFYRSDVWTNGPRGDPMRQNVEKATGKGFPKKGSATREEVLVRLGEPDQYSEDQKEFVYRWRMVIGFYPGCSSPDVKKTYLLRIRFDDAGVVRDFDYP